MGMVVTAQLDQNGIFYAGDILRCKVTFSYEPPGSTSSVDPALNCYILRSRASSVVRPITNTNEISSLRLTDGHIHGKPHGDPTAQLTSPVHLDPLLPLPEPAGGSNRSFSAFSTDGSGQDPVNSPFYSPTRSHHVPLASDRLSIDSTATSATGYSAYPRERWLPFGLPTRSDLPYPLAYSAPNGRFRAPSFLLPDELRSSHGFIDHFTTKPNNSSYFGSWLGFWGQQSSDGIGEPLKSPGLPTGSHGTSSDVESTNQSVSLSESLWNRFPSMLRAASSERSRTPLHTVSGMSRSSSSPHAASKMERILWAFAQVTGTFSVEPALVCKDKLIPLRTTAMYSSTGLATTTSGAGGNVMGGGSLGTDATPVAHLKSSSNSLPSLASRSGGGGAYRNAPKWPVFSTPPSILCSDLTLRPGQCRTITYELKLPEHLPSTFRGKAIRFSYTLVLVIQKSALNQKSHIIQVPFKILARVDQGGSFVPYDVLSPVVMVKDESVVQESTSPESKLLAGFDSIDLSCDSYLEEILTAVRNAAQSDGNDSMTNKTEILPNTTSHLPSDDKLSISQHVEHLCLQRQTVIARLKNHAGQCVAYITLPKSRFQVGETITGSIQFMNTSVSCYQMSVWLESEEIIAPEFAIQSPQITRAMTRRVYDEYHDFCRFVQCTSFALCAPPSHSTPTTFHTSAVQLAWCLRIEFIITDTVVMGDNAWSLTLPTSPSLATQSNATPSLPIFEPLKTSHQYHIQSSTAVETIPTETLSCTLPLTIYPGNQRLNGHLDGASFAAQRFTLPV
ncbi:Golgi membrane exchange factor (Ric1p-Rgp1p) subunit [Dispira simplex]|nr:Golgi membrane exchange factor (Ric1p-Rgp1p) subunit [Dispira simplex]